MALMRLSLKTRDGAEVATEELNGTAYPDVVTREGLTYILKRLTPDKKTGIYCEATPVSLPVGG